MNLNADICETQGCSKTASRLTAKPEGPIIEVCQDCWNAIYRS